jgi:hypothetical protein
VNLVGLKNKEMTMNSGWTFFDGNLLGVPMGRRLISPSNSKEKTGCTQLVQPEMAVVPYFDAKK